MNKDTIVASTIGFSLGLVAAIMLWVVPRIMPKNVPKPSPVASSQEIQVTNDEISPTQGFTITSPQDGEVVPGEAVKISGVAPGAVTVTVTTPEQSQVATPNSQGEFSTTLALAEGANQIVVTSITKNAQDTKTLSVYQFADGI